MKPDHIEQSKPIRVQLSRRKGWRMPPNTVKVDRSTKWGNPHDWRDWREQWPFKGPEAPGGYDRSGYYVPPEISRDDWCKSMAVQAFEEDIRDGQIALLFHELRGKNLACWCPLDQPCHADVLLELANA